MNSYWRQSSHAQRVKYVRDSLRSNPDYRRKRRNKGFVTHNLSERQKEEAYERFVDSQTLLKYRVQNLAEVCVRREGFADVM